MRRLLHLAAELHSYFAKILERLLLLPEIEEPGWRSPYSWAILKMGEDMGRIEARKEAGKVPCHHGQVRPG